MKTEINIFIALAIILIHWLADFVLQTDDMAKGKSKDNGWLIIHTLVYTVVWLTVGIVTILVGLIMSWVGHSLCQECICHYMLPLLGFCAITFVCHTITDYFTSRLNSKLYSEGKIHLFFVSVGFDQFLHYLQLFFTFNYLF